MTKMNFFLIEKMILLWNGIVAPGIEWIASQHTPASHKRTFDGTVLIDSLIAIMRTSGIEPARILRQAA
jgi:hypothetical protein